MNSVDKLTIKDIIRIKRDFVASNTLFNQEELRMYVRGEMLAYNHLLKIIDKQEKEYFIAKYSEYLHRVQIKIDKRKVEHSQKNREQDECMEILCGYNNGLVWVLSLIKPEIEYE